QQVEVRGAGEATPPPSPIERDSIMDLLLRISGYVGTEYRGDTANFVADSSVLILLGKAQVAREGYQLVADSSITYDDRIGEACGYGNPVLHAPGMGSPIASSMVCYDVRRRRGFARGARTQVDQGATWLVSGDMYYIGEDIYSHNAIFTDCNDPSPHYHFAAKEMKVVRNNILVARNVTMSFADVKVFWLPFFVQSLSRGRRSGILMPRFGINDIARTSSRYSRQIEDVGVYWAISEYMGSELAMDWWADNYIALRGSFDYNYPNRFLRGGATLRQFWADEGGSEFTLATQNSWEPDERTRLGLSANFATSSRFVRQRTISSQELNRSIDSNASITRRFDWGNLSTGASRKQYLSDNTVTARPHASLTVSPITLFEALPGDERFFSNATLDGNISASFDTRDIGADNINFRTQGRRAFQTNVGTGFQLGNLRIGQRLSFDEDRLIERAFHVDTIPTVPGATTQRGSWNTTISYAQRLPSFFGNTNITPGVALGGSFVRNERSGNELVSSPVRADFSAALSTNLYRFFPGIGSLERMRHRISPSISYNYVPLAQADSLQRAVFTPTGIAERNTISFGVQQSFEAKFRGVGTDTVGAAPADTLPEAGDTASAGPRRRQQTQAVMLLSISTTALVYDFVRAREDNEGLTTAEITNTVQSDLLRGLQLTVSHDLWRDVDEPQPGFARREFAPHLSSINTGFSLNANSWLFRILHIGRSDSLPETGAVPTTADSTQAGPAVDRTGPEYGMIGTTRRTAEGTPRGAVGAWNAQFTYSLTRPRQLPEQQSFRSQENSMLTATFQLQPTENWSLNWRTGFSFTTSEFTDHILTLTRTLHDWDANFNFTKTQNGNFAFSFGVHLRANPDIKLDYSQSDLRGIEPRRF
ncbi:MAG TPA: putative LPS assembly protein LptD, partial [Longimicrobiales bacterium]|nr:putative LPS assembly protein LptD [Longimicrobiales bacterium]